MTQIVKRAGGLSRHSPDRNYFLSGEFLDELFSNNVEIADAVYNRILENLRAAGILTAFKKLYEARRYNEARKELGLDKLRPVGAFAFKDRGYVTPGGFVMDDVGISKYNERGSGFDIAFPHPIAVTGQYEDVATGDRAYKIEFFDNGKLSAFACEAESIASVQAIIKLTGRGVMVHALNATALIEFLGAFINSNKERLPLEKSASKLGLHGGEFLPYAENVLLNADESSMPVLKAVHEKGDYETWRTHMEAFCENPIFRANLAASFASPLLEVMDKQIFFLHTYGKAGVAKTTMMECCLSVWGDYRKLKNDWNATPVGIEQMAVALNNIPMGMNEAELLSPNSKTFKSHSEFIYMFEGGQTRLMGAKLGGFQRRGYWKSICLSNGENSLHTNESREGEQNRVIELYTDEPIFGDFSIEKIKDLITQNYGHAGREFVENCKNYDLDYLWNESRETFENHATGKQAANMATICVGCFLMYRIIFKKSEEEAYKQLVDMEIELYKFLKKPEDIDISAKAIMFISDWLTQNRAKFATKTKSKITGEEKPVQQVIHDCYGFVDEDEKRAFVLPSVLDMALMERGYNSKKTVRDMRDRGVLVCIENNRNTIQGYCLVTKASKKFYCIKIDSI